MNKWTRRSFIAAGALGGTALVIGVAVRPGHRTPTLAPMVTDAGEALVNAWVKIDADNRVTVIVPHAEMGQGAHSALAQMVADELDARWEDVRVMEAPAADGYANYALAKGFLLANVAVPKVLVPTVDGLLMKATELMNLQITGGSLSIRATGVYGMRVAGAAAKTLLLEAAAEAWGVPVRELTGREGQVLHAASGRSAPYADFAAAAGTRKPPATPRLKQPDEFTLMGRDVLRTDLLGKVTGAAQFGIDARLPGMKYAAIRRAPVFGATVARVDAEAAKARPGVVDVVQLDDAVAVVADGYWQAERALATVTVEWRETGAEHLDSSALFAQFERDMDAALTRGKEKTDLRIGNARRELAAASQVLEATYRVPYLAHTCMEPMNATAHVHDGHCEVWTGSQNPLGFRSSIAKALGLNPGKVRVHNAYLGGGFGRRAIPDYAIQAAQISAAAGVPVQLIWSREEDIRQDHYRPAVVSRFRAGIDAEGQLTAWENQFVDKHEPGEAPYIPYRVPHQFVHYAESPTHVPFGPWRSVDHSQHGFFTESFIDEVAHALAQDPYQFRRELLHDKPRHRAVLDLAADRADWGRPLAPGRGRGISLQESFGTLVAQVVEVTVDSGQVRVDRVVCAVDPGFAVSPDGLTAQMESGIIYGLSAALYDEISIRAGAVVESNFHDYPMVRLDEAPVIETHIIASGAPWGGAGEPGTPGIAPALTNAIFDATGTRIRELPVRRYQLDFRIEESDDMA